MKPKWTFDHTLIFAAILLLLGIGMGGLCVYAWGAPDTGLVFDHPINLHDAGIVDLGGSNTIESTTDGAPSPFIEAPTTEGWIAYSSLLIFIIMSLLKRQGILQRLGRWRYILLPLLSLTSAGLAEWAATRSGLALLAVFSSNMALGKLEEFITHGILGVPHTKEDTK
jgi:hypothetical protein